MKLDKNISMLETVLAGITESQSNSYNDGLEDAKKTVVAEYLRLKDLGRQQQFDVADIETPIEKLKKG